MPHYSGIIRLEGGFQMTGRSEKEAHQTVRDDLLALCRWLGNDHRWGHYGWQLGEISTTGVTKSEGEHFIMVKTRTNETVAISYEIQQLVQLWLEWQDEEETEESYEIIDTRTDHIVIRISP